MKTKFVLATFIAALGLAAFASPAKAGTDFHISLNVGVPHAPVVVVPARPVYAPRGYWKEVSVKTWVPERWVVTYGRRGREIRTLTPGYFTYHTDRVWVEYGHDRGYGYGNNNGGYGYARR